MIDIVEDLRRDIWRPFVEVYAKRDVDAFARLHSPDLIRAEAASGWVGGFDEYVARVGAFFHDMTAKGADLRIGFGFVEHVVSEEVASERGVYQIVMAVPDEQVQTFYGRFHTFARKSADRWRVTVDYDTDREVGEDDYHGATPLT